RGNAATHYGHAGPEFVRWLISRNESDTTSTDSNGQTLADMCAPSAAWLAARDAYISHVMTCPHCATSGVKKPRHCAEGERLRQNYDHTR
ncbi:hypothetical protein KX447_28670, partial [Escherichia coli]|nr:hypothetical protein [Escherichia coli]